MKKLLSISLFLLSFSLQAQDVRIPLVQFSLVMDSVQVLAIRTVGAPFLAANPQDTTQKIVFQNVYYELRRTRGRVAQVGNETIPIELSDLLRKYVLRVNLTPSELGFVNYFLGAINPAIVAKQPE